MDRELIMKELEADVRIWMEQFASCVRDRDYFRARWLFSESVYSFGTVAEFLEGLNDLAGRQWERVWDVTEDFDFRYERAHCWMSKDQACIAVPWSSRGVHSRMAETRNGRCTLLLKRESDGWKAHHTHFSMTPA